MLNGTLVFLKSKFNNKEFLTLFFLFLAYSFLLFRFFYFIFKYTSNILFWDEWDIVIPILKNTNPLSLFLFQHNEHRIGVGLLVLKILSQLSYWNSRVETLTIGVIIFFASILAFMIKKRLTGNLEIIDIVIPFIFFNLVQWENLILGFQIVYVLPLLFLFLNLFLFSLQPSRKTNWLLILISFLAAYSSFQGLFVGFITFLFFIFEFFKSKSKEYLIFSLLVILILFSYFINYAPSETLGQKVFNPFKFLSYIIIQINSFIGYYPNKVFQNNLKLIVVSLSLLIIPLASLLLFFSDLYYFIKSFKREFFILISLFLFSGLFSISTAIGRAGIGLSSASSFRYSTFLIPLYFGIYLSFSYITKRTAREIILIFLVISFVFFISQNSNLFYQKALNQEQGLNNWKTCYIKTENIATCNKVFLVFPGDRNKDLQKDLTELKSSNFNLFSK